MELPSPRESTDSQILANTNTRNSSDTEKIQLAREWKPSSWSKKWKLILRTGEIVQSLQLRTKDHADHAGLSPPLVLSKVCTTSKLGSSYLYLNNNWLTVLKVLNTGVAEDVKEDPWMEP
jgi:hypothetical protein